MVYQRDNSKYLRPTKYGNEQNHPSHIKIKFIVFEFAKILAKQNSAYGINLVSILNKSGCFGLI
jgi:hypothetical protein